MTDEETLDPHDWAALRALGHRALDDAMDYMESLRDRPAWEHAPAHVKARFDGPLPAGPQQVEDIYREYVEYVLPYQLGNSHPRFWGWVLGSGTPMGVIAEMLAAATDSVSGIYSFVSNNYVELQVLDWCKEMLGYPPGAGGLLTSGCSASNLIALAVAHVVQCPYCIDAYSQECLKNGSDLEQMTEALHVAVAIRGGASLVHGMQMREQVKKVSL